MIANASLPTSIESFLQAHPRMPGVVFAAVCLGILLGLAWPRILSWRRGKSRPVLDPLQVEELLLGAGALIVDLRGDAEFGTGHIRGCLHVPFQDLAARFPAPDPKARRALVLVDETDELSHRALDHLARRGFDWVYVLRGGMRAWRRASRPLAR
jgi:queuine tRNA-ribosyltransferase